MSIYIRKVQHKSPGFLVISEFCSHHIRYTYTVALVQSISFRYVNKLPLTGNDICALIVTIDKNVESGINTIIQSNAISSQRMLIRLPMVDLRPIRLK